MIKPLFRRAKEWPLALPPRFDRERIPTSLATGTRRLQSSARGDLAQVVLVFPFYYFFTTWEDPKQQAALFACCGELLRTLPATCEVIVIISSSDPGLRKAGQIWTAAQNRQGPLTVHAIATDSTPWIRDPFCTVLVNGVARIVEPCKFIATRVGDDLLPDELSTLLGHQKEVGDDIFAGGNILVGVDNIFVGADIASGIVHKHGETDEAAVTRALTELEKASGRTPIVVGTKTKVPDQTPPIPQVEGPPHVYHYGNHDSFQPVFHIDMFMSLAVGKDGRDAVVLGRPSLAREFLPDAWPLEAELDAELAEISDALQARGIAVHEIPMPLFGVLQDPGEIVFYYAPYPNALVQTGSSRRVWLPQFRMNWEAVSDIDAEVARIWREDLGYDVVPIPGCTQLASSVGGIHCATHDILRTAIQGEH